MSRLVFLTACLCCVFCRAQQPAPPDLGGISRLGTVTAPGPLGRPVYTSDGAGAAITYTLAWSVAGAPPIACTFYPQGSLDGTNWYPLATASSSSTAPLDCSAGSMVHFSFKPVLLFRVYVVSYTAGDASTAVAMIYQRGTR